MEDDKKNNETVRKITRGWPWFLAVFISIVAWAFVLLYPPEFMRGLFLSSADSGQFGDSFGILTALFSGLAFAGLVVTIRLQRIDIRATQAELRLAREIWEDQTKIMDAQRALVNKQSYESTFFHLLSESDSLLHRVGNIRGGGNEILRQLWQTIIERTLEQRTDGEVSIRELRTNFLHDLHAQSSGDAKKLFNHQAILTAILRDAPETANLITYARLVDNSMSNQNKALLVCYCNFVLNEELSTRIDSLYPAFVTFDKDTWGDSGLAQYFHKFYFT